MLLALGSRVRLKHTGDYGTISSLIDETMVNVRLDNGDEIPVFLEDLVRPEEKLKKAPVKAKIINKPEKKKPKPKPQPKVESQYTIIKSMGIQLAFEPILNADGRTTSYQIYLINDTRYTFLYTALLSLNNYQKFKVNGKLDPVSFEKVGEMLFDDLNDNPAVDIEGWQVTTQGTGPKLKKQVKLKAKQFFKKTITAPLLNKQVHHYKVFENFEKKETPGEDLKAYTKRVAKPVRKFDRGSQHSVSELANFTGELDLHIEKLDPENADKSNSEIIRIQLAHFDRFIEQAIKLGVENVFVIHGMGKGKLRDAIASRLIKNPDVSTFKNEFHPRYGFGATEVVFR